LDVWFGRLRRSTKGGTTRLAPSMASGDNPKSSTAEVTKARLGERAGVGKGA